MIETELTQNSYHTLERIAQAQPVDFEYRNKYLNRMLGTSAVMGLGGTGLGIYGAAGLIQSGFGWVDLGCLLVGGFASIAGNSGFVHFYDLKKRFREDPINVVDTHPYYLGSRVSLEATLVEKELGYRIKPLNHLNQLRYHSIENNGLFYFMDQLVLEEVEKRDYTEEDSCSDGDGGTSYSTIEHYQGTLTLRRRNHTAQIDYHYKQFMPTLFKEFLDLKGKMLALLWKEGNAGCPIEIVRNYFPHP